MQHRLEKFQHNEKGFTLLELLVSVVLLTIVVGALLSMFVTSTKTNITSAEVVDEGYMAQKHMEKIYSLGKDKSVSEIADHLFYNGYGYNSKIDLITHILGLEMESIILKQNYFMVYMMR